MVRKREEHPRNRLKCHTGNDDNGMVISRMSTAETTYAARILDVVEFRVDVGRWQAGTEATVLEVLDSGLLVEVADSRGHTLEIVSVPHAAVRVLEAPDQQRLAG